jgi:uncharacterized protein with HEPN domain
MSEKSEKANLEQMLKYIEDIQTITARHGSVHNALIDLEGQYAILMCLTQIGECMGKIQDEKLRQKFPAKSAVGMRNIIVHNYDGVDLTIVEKTVSQSIPELKTVLLQFLGRL